MILFRLARNMGQLHSLCHPQLVCVYSNGNDIMPRIFLHKGRGFKQSLEMATRERLAPQLATA
ncbi:hypothetical protein RchiOBHm_Chr4g0401641 [Rosa chinensis]|uniref:Uncharacterized protein n=1 Tax=Rosa chinensis TaxID=74649 RepID=A0A2P6QT59_ROSCH|nr:hypothetical protein RchiOBHm_Chr4g0401641 [Rosa chinensis]